MSSISIPQSWVDAGLVLGQGAQTKDDDTLKELLDQELDDYCEPRDPSTKELLSAAKPHVYTLSTQADKVIKIFREDQVGQMFGPDSSNRMNVGRVGESKDVRESIASRNLELLTQPRTQLYPRAGVDGITRYAVVQDRVQNLRARSTDPIPQIRQPMQVQGLTREQLTQILELTKDVPYLDWNPENVLAIKDTDQLALVDVEPVMKENMKQSIVGRIFTTLLSPAGAASQNESMKVMNLGGLSLFNVREADKDLVDNRVRQIACVALLKSAFVLALEIAAFVTATKHGKLSSKVHTCTKIWLALQSLGVIKWALTVVAPRKGTDLATIGPRIAVQFAMGGIPQVRTGPVAA